MTEKTVFHADVSPKLAGTEEMRSQGTEFEFTGSCCFLLMPRCLCAPTGGSSRRSALKRGGQLQQQVGRISLVSSGESCMQGSTET